MWAKHKSQPGFTIVELLIVVVVIAILAAITIVSYNGIQERARNSKILSDINQVHKLVELHYAEFGEYPKTGAAMDTANLGYADSNCAYNTSTRQSNWVPGLNKAIPQSDGNPRGGAKPGNGPTAFNGCYVYISDGTSYVLSAWNMLTSPQTSVLYKRIGSRESTGDYRCNHGNIGGNAGSTYDINEDFYKFSYTISNITNCNESPPPGA